MDSYSLEDAAADLQLDLVDRRPTHEMRTPGAWRWLAPLGMGASFAGLLAISILARPQAASFEFPEEDPGPAQTAHHEPGLAAEFAVGPGRSPAQVPPASPASSGPLVIVADGAESLASVVTRSHEEPGHRARTPRHVETGAPQSMPAPSVQRSDQIGEVDAGLDEDLLPNVEAAEVEQAPDEWAQAPQSDSGPDEPALPGSEFSLDE